jgi:hypothetical protein
VHWSSDSLPWGGLTAGPPARVQAAKEAFMAGLQGTARELPAVVSQFLVYTAGLGFQEKPDYVKCRAMFQGPATREGGKGVKRGP